MQNNLMKIVEPFLPEKPGQKDFILAYLKTGRILTRFKTVYVMSIFEAPARITELKADGWPIKSVDVRIETQLGKTTSVVIWYLDTKTVEHHL